MKKSISLMLALVLIMVLTVGVSAQTVGAEGGATITINNAAKGETYNVYKLFGATVTGTEGGSIAYTGEIPTALEEYFSQDTEGNISLKAAEDNIRLFEALKTWASTVAVTATAESDGSALIFQGLEYGYYVVTSSQGASAISVTSTNPNATIYDKNTTEPGNLDKVIDDEDVNFGDTVTYTITFNTANFDGTGIDAKRITSYTITDDLPGYLKDVTVTEIKVDGTGIVAQQFNANNQITIPWVDANNNSLYDNGATVTITYTAKITDEAAIAGNGNINTAKLTWNNGENVDKNITATATAKTFAFVLKKVDQKGNALSGATFQLPFYVEAADDGGYNYAGTDAGTGLTNTVTTPTDGVIIIKGVASGTYSVTETAAPAGYNKLTAPIDVVVNEATATTTNSTTYLDENGDKVDAQTEKAVEVTYANEALAADVVVVVNKTGSELPSTGGMGTTVFYVIGGLLMAGAVVMLITKKRMA